MVADAEVTPRRRRTRRRKAENPPPPDRFNYVWWTCVILGTGNLLVWNAFIAAFDYFDEKFGPTIEFKLSNAFNYPSLLILAISVRFGSNFSFRLRIVTFLLVAFVAVVFAPLTGFLGLSTAAEEWLVLGLALAAGVANGLLFGALSAFATTFPASYMTGLMSGMGVAGLVAGGLRIVTKAAMPNTVEGTQRSSEIYFGLAGLTILAAVVSYLVAERTRFVRYYMDKTNGVVSLDGAALDTEVGGGSSSSGSSLISTGGDSDGGGGGGRSGFPSPNAIDRRRHHGDSGENTPLVSRRGMGMRTEEATTPSALVLGLSAALDAAAPVAMHSPPKPSLRTVMSKIWPMALAVFGVFFVSLSLFPGLISLIPAESSKFERTWFTILLIFEFQVGDYCGRTAPRFFRDVPLRLIYLLAALRLAFFPLFLFCVSPRLFTTDVAPYVIMAFFAFSNGYLGTLLMMFAPGRVALHERAMTGTAMSFFLNLGVLVGVNFSLIFSGLHASGDPSGDSSGSGGG